jgi:hypothetical protein
MLTLSATADRHSTAEALALLLVALALHPPGTAPQPHGGRTVTAPADLCRQPEQSTPVIV